MSTRHLWRRFVTTAAALLVLAGVPAVTVGLTAAPAAAVGSYANGDIAIKALTYVGQWGGEACRDAGLLDGGNTGTTVGGYGGGQCRTFVNCIVKLVSGGSQYPVGGGGDYFASLDAYGDEVTSLDDLRQGDIVQIGQGVHTYIIVGRVSGSTFDVVDSNSQPYGSTYEKVRRYNRTVTLDSNNRAFRLGTVSASGSGTNARLVGDFNGDGKADAAVMIGGTGAAKVALSTGSNFGYPGDWSYGHSVGATAYLAGDTNGDGRDDLVAYFASSKTWKVSLSSGSGFWSPTEWAYDGSLTPDRIYLADVTGDGKDDKVMWAGGSWWVSVSSGSGFWSPQQWIAGHGIGSNNQEVADFNGDNLADAAVYVASTGKWYVALSTGSSFGYPGEWAAGHGMGSTFRLVGDTTGGGKADIAYFSVPNAKWYVSASSGSGFWGETEWSYDAGYTSMTNAFLADVTGDGKADKVLFYSNTGNWFVGVSAGSGFWSLTEWIPGHGAGS